MRKKKKLYIDSSSRLFAFGLYLLIFMIAMKHPDKTINRNGATYLALGDSYTIGEQVSNKESFPVQVTRLLNKDGFDINAPQVVAQTGWTTDELQSAIDKSVLQDHYDFVTLLIGVNNQYRGRSAESYRPQFESLLKQAIRFAGNDAGHVIVLSIPDWGVTPFAKDRDRNQIAAEIDAYNAINRELALRYHVPYLDITPWTREASADQDLLAADGLHPSGKEYKRWATAIAEKIRNTK